jgi:hypothetical protein
VNNWIELDDMCSDYAANCVVSRVYIAQLTDCYQESWTIYSTKYLARFKFFKHNEWRCDVLITAITCSAPGD